jgi:hypothetical protein
VNKGKEELMTEERQTGPKVLLMGCAFLAPSRRLKSLAATGLYDMEGKPDRMI